MTSVVAGPPVVGDSASRLGRVALAPFAPWLAAALALAVGMVLVDSLPVGVVHDDGMYVILAKSLATGQGYRWLHVPGAPPATHFPPGYPAVLALLWLLFPSFPGNVVAFKLANACFAAFAVAGFAILARRRFGFSPWGSAAFALASMLGIPTLTLSVMVMSEPLFLALLVPTLLLAERVIDGDAARRIDVAGLALLTGALTLVRTHGVALVAAILLLLVIRRRRFADAALFLVIAAAVLLPWQLWVSRHSGILPLPMRGNYESYGAWLAAGIHSDGIGLLARTAARTSTELGAMFATLVAPSLPAVPRVAGLVVLGALSVFGLRPFWRGAPVAALFLALYSLIVIVWPFTPARFAWGVWPLLMIPPVLGARAAIAWAPPAPAARTIRIAALAATLGVALGYGTYTVRGYRGRWWASIPRAGAENLRPLVLWAARRTSSGDVLAVEAESAVYLYAGRQTVPVHTFTVEQYFKPRSPAENAAIIRQLLVSYRVSAVAVSSRSMRDAVRVLTDTVPPALVVRDSFPGGIVLTPSSR